MIDKETAKALVAQTIEDNQSGLITPLRVRNILGLLIDDIYDEMSEYDRRIAILEDATFPVQ